MDHAVLAARLAEPDVAGLPDWQAAAALNAPDPALPRRRVDVATADAREVLLAAGEWAPIVMAAEAGSAAPAELRGLCITVRDTLMLTETLRTSVPAHYAVIEGALGALVQAGLVTQPVAVALLALAEAPQSWAEANGIDVTPAAVQAARRGR